MAVVPVDAIRGLTRATTAKLTEGSVNANKLAKRLRREIGRAIQDFSMRSSTLSLVIRAWLDHVTSTLSRVNWSMTSRKNVPQSRVPLTPSSGGS